MFWASLNVPRRSGNMKKLLFVIYSMGYGGAEKSLLNLMNELPENTYEVDLLLFQKRGDFLKQLPAWVRVLDAPEAMQRLHAPIRKAGKYICVKIIGTICAQITRRTRKERRAYRWGHFYKRLIGNIPGHYDVAIAYSGMENLYLIGDCVDADRKIVWIHSDYVRGGYSRKDDYPYLQKMDGIVSISEECVDVLRKEFPEFSARMYCIENITSSAMVRKQADAYIPVEMADDMCNILSIGRLSPEKAFHRAVDAAAILKKSGMRFRWYIIGEGNQRTALINQIEKNGVSDHVILLGTRNNPYPYIKACTILVQTSDYEGKSVVLDEAKILAKPIIVTDYQTVRDQILPEKEGIIVDMTAESIAEAIQRMLTDHTLRLNVVQYLESNEYGNSDEIQKYRKVIDA